VFVRIRNADQHLPPRAFIRAAERVGLLDRIDRHATETALSLLAGRPQGEHHLHVNLAGTARGKGEIVALLTEAASAGTFDPGRLTFEIADGAAAADVDAIREFAQAVREIGCHVALDHFGTGLASFTHLDKLPVDCLKIHGGLISGLRGSRTSRLIVKAIVDVAHGLGIEPIAQRVADRAAIHVLEHYGVRYGQGAALGEPSALLAERRAA
jgi:EAL domain-containing protein (putative c-di-GMP-specific phosphodiesterase class I)